MIPTLLGLIFAANVLTPCRPSTPGRYVVQSKRALFGWRTNARYSTLADAMECLRLFSRCHPGNRYRLLVDKA